MQDAFVYLRDIDNWRIAGVFALSAAMLANSEPSRAMAVEAAARTEREYERLRQGECNCIHCQQARNPTISHRERERLASQDPNAHWDWRHQYNGFVDRRLNDEGLPFYAGCGCYHCRNSQEGSDEAEARARALLLSCLTPTQQEEYAASRSFTVKVKSGNRYRIERHRNYNVIWLDKKGGIISELCAGPVEEVPLEDQMLAQKLLLEVDEAGFLAIANRRNIVPCLSLSGALP